MKLLYKSFRGADNTGAWIRKKDGGPDVAWIQVDLGETFNITAVQTQGRDNLGQWITKFTLDYSTEENDWTNYADYDGKPKVF